MEELRVGEIGNFALHLLDVGQGECAVLDFPDGSFGLVDAGPPEQTHLMLAAVQMRVAAGRLFRFAALTHWDRDHAGAMPAIVSQYRPREFIRPNVDIHLMERLCADHETLKPLHLYKEVLDALGPGVSEQPLGARQQVRDVGVGVEVWVLSPDSGTHSRIREAVEACNGYAHLRGLRNSASLVLWIRAFGRNLLLPGEVDGDMARRLECHFGPHHSPGKIHHSDPRASWLKLSHHGARKGTSAEFLRIWSDLPFIASASHGARYGHPHLETLRLVHFEFQGRVMCTRLGVGCSFAIRDARKYSPERPEEWFTSSLKRVPGRPVESCYGTITVNVASDGSMRVVGSSTQSACPYGGPVGALDL